MSQDKMKPKFDKKTKVRSSDKGEQVSLYLPKPGESLQAKYRRPYTILDKIGPLNYFISTPDRRRKTRLCHINIVKEYHAPRVVLNNIPIAEDVEDSLLYHPDLPLKNTKTLQDVPNRLQHLEPEDRHHKFNSRASHIVLEHSETTYWHGARLYVNR